VFLAFVEDEGIPLASFNSLIAAFIKSRAFTEDGVKVFFGFS
jgi:hypothetical protein